MAWKFAARARDRLAKADNIGSSNIMAV